MTSNAENGVLESRKDYEDNPTSQYEFWETELKSSQKRLREWEKQGTVIVSKFEGGKIKQNSNEANRAGVGGFRINLFHSNVKTQQSMLYGNLPKVDVSRRYEDPNDDTGRVCAMILERMLNNDIQDNDEAYNSVLKAVLQDRLLPGLGCAKVRYEVDTEEEDLGELDEEGDPMMTEKVVREDAPIDYYHWRDVQWGWGRTFSDLPWIGFKTHMDKDEILGRFGEEAAEGVELKDQSTTSEKDQQEDPTQGGPWKKGEIWEIWDKKKRKVVWISLGYDEVLDTKDDFLELSGFYPCPPFLLANQTTTLYKPTSDYHLAQDLYNEIDQLETRISVITEAVKVVGVYDAEAEAIGRMFKEGMDNDLIPVSKWAMFSEKGGLQGQIEWFPIKDVVEALMKLVEMRDDAISLLQQLTGMADVMRGELKNQYEGNAQTETKARFASVRIQALQEEFATFASNLLKIKAEIIGRHFDPESIAMYANLDSSFDKEIVPAAIELLKNPQKAMLRVVIRPESVAMVDHDQLKNERTSYITALGSFMQAATPLMDQDPSAKPYVLSLLQWGLAGFKGAGEIEGVLDKAIQASMKEAEKPDKPDPEQQRMQMAQQIEQQKHQNDMQAIQAKSMADMQLRKMDLQAKLAVASADMKADLEVIIASMQADIETERQTSMINAQQQTMATENEIRKDAVSTALKIEELGAAAKLKPDTTGGSEDAAN